MNPNDGDSKLVRLYKIMLADRKLKLKGSTSPDINVLVKRDIEELEQKIKRITQAENGKEGDL